MKKLLIATTNPGKFAEIKKYLSDLPLMLVGLTDIHMTQKPEESGKTFQENAVIKAKFYLAKSGLPTVADDGGFEIDALGGAPGVKTHRWIHPEYDNEDEELIEYTMTKMLGVTPLKRGAQLRVVIAFAAPGREIVTAEDKIRGIVSEKPSLYRTPGFPYRSLLFIPELGKFYIDNELTDAENEAYNHRKRALEKLKPIILKKLC
jgi:XTP/dITP diphosphohydrolase